MSTVADRQPKVVEIDERIKQAREQERRVLDKAAAAMAKHNAAAAKWRAEADEDVRAGKDPKPAPQPPDESVRNTVLAAFRAEIDRDLKERRWAIVSAADSIRAEVKREAVEILKEAAAPLDDLRGLAARLRAVVSALDDVADARQALDPSQRTPLRRPPAVTLDVLVAAVDYGTDELLGGRDIPKPRTLGMQAGSTLSDPPAETREPEPQPVQQTVTVQQVRTSKGALP